MDMLGVTGGFIHKITKTRGRDGGANCPDMIQTIPILNMKRYSPQRQHSPHENKKPFFNNVICKTQPEDRLFSSLSPPRSPVNHVSPHNGLNSLAIASSLLDSSSPTLFMNQQQNNIHPDHKSANNTSPHQQLHHQFQQHSVYEHISQIKQPPSPDSPGSPPLVNLNFQGGSAGLDVKPSLDTMGTSLSSLSNGTGPTAVLTPADIHQLAAAGQLVTGQNGQLYLMMPSDAQVLAGAVAAATSIPPCALMPPSPPSPPPLICDGMMRWGPEDGVGSMSPPIRKGSGPASVGLQQQRGISSVGNHLETSNSGSDSSNASFTDSNGSKDLRRRVSHNEVERRRRDRINTWIGELQKLLPPDEQTRSQHLSKGAILKRVCEYFRQVSQSVRQLEAAKWAVDQSQVDNGVLQRSLHQLQIENQMLRNQLQTSQVGNRKQVTQEINGNCSPGSLQQPSDKIVCQTQIDPPRS